MREPPRADTGPTTPTGWWYACASGTDYLKGGWFTINGSDYLFGPNGYMSTGFLQRPSGEWVYADSEGALVGGWVRDGASWYYLDPATKNMRTGWLLDRGSWYYLSDSGQDGDRLGQGWWHLVLPGRQRRMGQVT